MPSDQKKKPAGRFSTVDQFVPPQSIEAEMSALGAMMLSKRAAEDLSEPHVLVPADFYVPAHQAIFRAIRDLATAGKPVDFVTMQDSLTKTDKLDEVGGVDYLVQIAESVPSAANAMYYAGIVREKHILRECETVAHKIIEDVCGSGGLAASDVLANASSRIERLTAGVYRDAGDLLCEVPIDNQEKGVPTFLPSIDSLVSTNGAPCGQMTIIAAGTNIGKTPFMTQIAFDLWRNGYPVCYALFADLTSAQLKRRIMKLATGFDSPPDSLEASTLWYAARDQLIGDPYAANFTIYDAQSEEDSDTIEAFRSWLIPRHREHKFSAIFIDYLQEIRTTDRTTNEVERIMAVARKVRSLARKLGDETATFIGSQLTETTSGPKTRYGRDIANMAGLGLMIDRQLGARETAIRVMKNRFGNAYGVEGFEFDSQYLRFLDPMGDDGWRTEYMVSQH